MKKYVKIIVVLLIIAAGITAGILVYKKTNIANYVDKKIINSPDKEVIATIAGKKLTEGECRVYLANMRSEVESIYGTEVWDYKLDAEGTTYSQMMKESLLDKMVYIKLVCANAEQYGVALDSNDTIDINGYVNTFFENITEETAKKYDIDRELVTKIYEENVLAEKVYDKLTLGYDVEADKDNCKQMDFVRIMVSKCYEDENGNIIYYNSEEANAARETAESLLEQAKNGDFYKVASKSDASTNPRVTLGAVDLPERISNKVMSLKTGMMSDVLETDEAFYIFYCTSDYNEAATEQAIQNRIKSERDAYFKNLYSLWYENSNIEINKEAYNSIEL